MRTQCQVTQKKPRRLNGKCRVSGTGKIYCTLRSSLATLGIIHNLPTPKVIIIITLQQQQQQTLQQQMEASAPNIPRYIARSEKEESDVR